MCVVLTQNCTNHLCWLWWFWYSVQYRRYRHKFFQKISSLLFQTNHKLHVQCLIYLDLSKLCSVACVQLSLKELLDQSNINSVCCWLMSVDESHKLYIDVNVTKLLGEGSWAIVYDTYLHDDVIRQWNILNFWYLYL